MEPPDVGCYHPEMIRSSSRCTAARGAVVSVLVVNYVILAGRIQPCLRIPPPPAPLC